jgi:hypothetical protein
MGEEVWIAKEETTTSVLEDGKKKRPRKNICRNEGPYQQSRVAKSHDTQAVRPTPAEEDLRSSASIKTSTGSHFLQG